MAQVWVPPGEQYFRDFTGSPLALGTVELYIPNTLTPKLSYADEGGTVVNPNPIPLDAAGACVIWGTGLYRMIAKDSGGVTVFDKVTGFVSSGGGGGGDVFGPGASIPGNFAVWSSSDGTQIADGGNVGTLAHLNTINDANWAGTALSLPHGGTGGTDAPTARASLGLGSLALLNTITSSLVTDFFSTQETNLASMLVQGVNVTIVHNAGAHTFTISASGGSGGGNVTGPVSALNGGLVQFDGTTGTLIKDSAVVPTANAFTLLGHTFSQMRTDLGLGTSALVNTGTSGATVPLLSTANTWTLAQTFTAAPVFSDQPNSRVALGLGSAAVSAATDFEPAGAYVGINAQTGTAYTLVLTDQGKLVTMSNAAANTLTVTKQASVAWPARSRIDVASLAAGQTTIVADTGVTIVSTPGLKLRAQNSGASLVRLASDSWLLTGDLSA